MHRKIPQKPGPRIEIAFKNVMIDRKPKIWVRGFVPHSHMVLSAETLDEAGVHWRGETPYVMNTQGCLEIAASESEGEAVEEAEYWEIFDSMRPVEKTEGPVPLFAWRTAEPKHIDIHANTPDGDSAQSSLHLCVFDENTTIREEVHDGTLQGVFFCPKGDGPHPVVICIGGSDGWYTEARPALLASHGIAAFSVAYFGGDPLPETLSEVPLEFFDRAVDWLNDYPAVDTARLGIYGYSKGGELALLLASRDPRIRAVAAYSPSSVVWQSPNAGAPKSSWSEDGVPLPFVPMHFSGMKILKIMSGRPVAFRDVYAQGMAKHPDKAEEARIPVEQIAGPVFLVSGTEDGVWPSSEMADSIETALKEAGKDVTHLKYPGAGHLTTLPGLPAPEVFDTLIFGGTSRMSSRALEDAWQKMVMFFTTNL